MNNELHGKTYLVTGSSRGIGYWTAHELVSLGAHVILVGHHQGRGERAESTIRQAFGSDAARFFKTDLSAQDEIRQLSQRMKEQYTKLEGLVNNAGGFFLQRQESVDGIEMTLALNHLNYFMVTLLSLNLLLDTPSSRIVNVSSEAHRGQKMHFDNTQLKTGYSGMQAYGQSKLANLLFTYELSRRLEDVAVTVNALHPGFVHTHLGKQSWLVRPFLDIIHALFAMSPQDGAETSIYLASSPAVQGVSGKYFIDKKPVPSSPPSQDRDSAQTLWEISASLTGLDPQATLPG